jgi:hypothetical protein
MSISYTKTNWQDLPTKATPLSADNLNKIENGIADSVNGVNTNAHDIAELQTRISQITSGGLGYVSYEMFDAVLDGVHDDSVAVLSAHQYANSHNVPVIQRGGRLLVNFSNIPVKTDCDLSLDFVITDSTPNDAYVIQHDSIEDVTATLDISAGANAVTDAIFKGHFCVPYIESDALSLGKRNSGTEAHNVQFWHHQPIAVDLNGNILTMYPWMSINESGVHLRGYSRLDEKGVSIKGGNVIVNKTNAYGFPTLFKISRNNTKVADFTVNCPTAINSETSSGGLFAVHNCCNILFSNINGLNHSVRASLAHSYVIDIYGAWNVRIENCNIMQGWGAMASHFSDTVCMENCTFNRWDGHYGVFGTNIIHNCNFVGLGMIRIGYGSGSVDIDGCTCSQNSADTSLSNGFVSFRNDFPVYYQGTVFVRHLRSTSTRLFNLSDYALNDPGTVGTFPDEALRLICYNLDVGSAMNALNTTAASRKIDFYAYDCPKIRFYHTTTGITIRLYNSNIASANVGDNNVYIYGGSAGDIETTGIVWVSGARIVGNVKAGSVEFYSCHSRTALTVTANNIRVENCGGLAQVALVGEAIVHNSYKWGTVSVSGAIKQVSKTLAFDANGVADLDFVITTSTVLAVYSRTKIDSNPIFFIPFTNDTKWNTKAETVSGPVADQSVAVSIYYIDKT